MLLILSGVLWGAFHGLLGAIGLWYMIAIVVMGVLHVEFTKNSWGD